MEFAEQLDLAVRQTRRIANRIPYGYNTETPFTHEAFVSFMMNLPRRLRQDQRAYKMIMTRNFPVLFSLPFNKSKSADYTRAPEVSGAVRPILDKIRRHRWYLALPHVKDKRRLNLMLSDYLPHGSLGEVISENISDLERRKILDGIDLNEIWRQHQSGAKDNNRVIRVLVSLEIALKLQEQNDGRPLLA
jgi:hypothetical protein